MKSFMGGLRGQSVRGKRSYSRQKRQTKISSQGVKGKYILNRGCRGRGGLRGGSGVLVVDAVWKIWQKISPRV